MSSDKILRLVKLKICTDSRNIVPGCVFIAIKGTNLNGEEFIEEAIKKGAAYVVVSKHYKSTQILSPHIYIRVNNVRRFLSKLAANKYRREIPNIVAITGTNGSDCNNDSSCSSKHIHHTTSIHISINSHHNRSSSHHA